MKNLRLIYNQKSIIKFFFKRKGTFPVNSTLNMTKNLQLPILPIYAQHRPRGLFKDHSFYDYNW